MLEPCGVFSPPGHVGLKRFREFDNRVLYFGLVFLFVVVFIDSFIFSSGRVASITRGPSMGKVSSQSI